MSHGSSAARHAPLGLVPSSVAGLISGSRGQASYIASKHALQCIAESLQEELQPFNIQVQTINPGAFLTGFNETLAESAFQWQDDTRTS